MWATNPLLCPFDHIFIFELDLTGKGKSIFTNFPVSSRLRTKLTSTGEIELFSRASAVLPTFDSSGNCHTVPSAHVSLTAITVRFGKAFIFRWISVFHLAQRDAFRAPRCSCR